MFTKEDIAQIESRGSNPATVEAQVERFKVGFPWMKIAAPATPQKGITVLSEEAVKDAADLVTQASSETNNIESITPIKMEMEELLKTVVMLANTQVDGQYIYSGANTTTPAYTIDENGYAELGKPSFKKPD